MCSLLLGAIVIEIKFIIVPVQRHYSPFNKKFDMSNKLSNCSQVARKIVWYLSIELSGVVVVVVRPGHPGVVVVWLRLWSDLSINVWLWLWLEVMEC